MTTVYDSGGKCLGDKWVDLSELQTDTKKVILHIIHLDETADQLDVIVNDSIIDNLM